MGKRKKPRKGKKPRKKKASHQKDKKFAGGKNPYEEIRERVDEDPRLLWQNLPPEDPATVSARIQQREGKTTIVVIGTSPDSCGLVPWYEEVDEIWALNDCHHLPFMQMEKVTAWFQLHQPWRYRRPTPRYGADHWDFLKEKHDFPIYMQRVDEEVPSSVEFPLYEIAKEFLWSEDMSEWLLGRGHGYQRKYFSCSFSYMAGLAYLKWKRGDWGDKPLRIEMYGCELAQQKEYIMQRPNTEFWVGLGVGLGVQFYVPAITRIMQGVFYAYRYPSVQDLRNEIEQQKANGKWDDRNWEPPEGIEEEDNVGEWPEPAHPNIVQTQFGGIFSDFDDHQPIIASYVIEDPDKEVDLIVPGYGMGLDE